MIICYRRSRYDSHADRTLHRLPALFTAIILLSLGVTISPNPAAAQLGELEVTPEDPPESIPVFRNYPDEAAVIILSSLNDLEIESNMGIVADESRPEDGRYVVILEPYRQILTLRAPDFQETRISVPDMSPREVEYYRVEPKDPDPVDGEGTLVLRSIPEGAQITVGGIPDFDQQTPYTFAEWGAQSYRIRLEKDRYEPKEIVVNIEDGRAISRTLELTPNYGYLTIDEDATLRVQYHGEGSAGRVSYDPGEPVDLPVGQHHVRLERDYYETEEESLVIDPGETKSWQPDSRPLYGRLFVETNTDAEVEVRDNFAPETPPGADYTYVESGRKEVEVSAPGYVSEEFTVDMPAGGSIDTSLTLISEAEAEDLERRREQPRGVIMAAADIEGAEIWINGEMAGRGQAEETVLTGTHEVEFRHGTGTRTESVYVEPAEMEQVFTELRPSRTNAITLNTLMPGLGHIYTGRSRGYVYGPVFLAAAAGSWLIWQHYQNIESDFSAAVDDYETAKMNYQEANSLEEASHYRDEVNYLFQDRIPDLHDDRSEAFDQFRYVAMGAAAVYAINMVDILLTRPEHGYRSGEPPEGFSASIVPSGGGTVSASLSWRVTF